MSQKYTSPPNPFHFNAQVWNKVRQIPPGTVATYGQIASMISPPSGVEPKTYIAFSPRWVGSAMANCPGDVPWHRVINSQGKISVRRSGGHLKQKELLLSEGICFDEHDRIDLSEYGWEP